VDCGRVRGEEDETRMAYLAGGLLGAGHMCVEWREEVRWWWLRMKRERVESNSYIQTRDVGCVLVSVKQSVTECVAVRGSG
jgi:hypothetical protein